MHPKHWATTTPDAPALSMLDADTQVIATLSYAELDARANQYAHALRALGLGHGDRLAVWKRNSLSFLPLYWAAQRAGLLIVPVAVHLSDAETDYIIRDCGAKALITDGRVEAAPRLIETLQSSEQLAKAIFAADYPLQGVADWDAFAADFPTTPIADEMAGGHMMYSSGTTGRPKGIKPQIISEDVQAVHPFIPVVAGLYGANQATHYLSPAPLYHAAPLVYCTLIHRLGGHVFVMDKFREEPFLKAIEDHQITFTQTVPTMFVRLLKQPEPVRTAYDTSSLTCVVHAAAPCPTSIKRQMIDWFGPVIHEYYAGTEGNGMTYCNSADWLDHPGTVGRAVYGQVHICHEDTGEPLPIGETGVVYFSDGSSFEYHNDAAKTDASHNPKQRGLTTLGDIGHLDADGFLYLTDRKANMIISGGVNIYPQETENVLLDHSSVLDAAVLGVPCPDMGERVKAFIQCVPGATIDGLDAELIAFTRERISHVKAPREIAFVDQLPRTESGKLLKRRLLDS